METIVLIKIRTLFFLNSTYLKKNIFSNSFVGSCIFLIPWCIAPESLLAGATFDLGNIYNALYSDH